MSGFEGDFIIDQEAATRIYDILVEECGAHAESVGEFLACANTTTEYRFCGDLGFGGKFWNTNSRWYVSCYTENQTEQINQKIENANRRLAELLASLNPPRK